MMMADLRTALSEVAEALTAAGVPSALDPRDVTLPGAWVQLLTLDHDMLCGDLTALVGVDLISPDVGTLEALDQLGAMLPRALSVLGVNAGTPTVARTILLPDSATAYPALRVSLLITVPAGVPAALMEGT